MAEFVHKLTGDAQRVEMIPVDYGRRVVMKHGAKLQDVEVPALGTAVAIMFREMLKVPVYLGSQPSPNAALPLPYENAIDC